MEFIKFSTFLILLKKIGNNLSSDKLTKYVLVYLCTQVAK